MRRACATPSSSRRCRLIEDDAAFALVVPTFEGTPFLRRLLDWLKEGGYPGYVVLSDDSSGTHREFVASCPERYPGLWIDVDAHPHPTPFLGKLASTLSRLEARHVMLCAQDDFVDAGALERLLALLESDDGLSCARGRIARFRVTAGEAGARDARLDWNKHAMLAYEEATPLERVLAHLRRYTATLYSVHRRERLLDAFRRTAAATRSAIFFQYLSSCLCVAMGRVACTDDLFLLRQIQPQSWSATMPEGDYEHWPLLVTSPAYSTYYQEFRGALAGYLAALPGGGDGEAIGRAIDREFPALIRRTFGGQSVSDPANDAFFARLGKAGTPEHALVNRVARFVLRYDGTY